MKTILFGGFFVVTVTFGVIIYVGNTAQGSSLGLLYGGEEGLDWDDGDTFKALIPTWSCIWLIPN